MLLSAWFLNSIDGGGNQIDFSAPVKIIVEFYFPRFPSQNSTFFPGYSLFLGLKNGGIVMPKIDTDLFFFFFKLAIPLKRACLALETKFRGRACEDLQIQIQACEGDTYEKKGEDAGARFPRAFAAAGKLPRQLLPPFPIFIIHLDYWVGWTINTRV